MSEDPYAAPELEVPAAQPLDEAGHLLLASLVHRYSWDTIEQALFLPVYWEQRKAEA